MNEQAIIEAAKKFRATVEALDSEGLIRGTCVLHAALLENYHRAALELDRLLAGGLCGPSDAELFRGRLARTENPS